MIWMCIAENAKAQFKKINMGKRTLREMAVTENCEDNLNWVWKGRRILPKDGKVIKNSQEPLQIKIEKLDEQ